MDNKEKRNAFYSEMGNLIRGLRKNRGWPQEYLAEKINVSPSFLSDVENGKSGMDTYLFSKLCKVLETDPNRLLRFDVDIKADDVRRHYVEISKLDDERRDIVIVTIKAMLKELNKGIDKVK